MKKPGTSEPRLAVISLGLVAHQDCGVPSFFPLSGGSWRARSSHVQAPIAKGVE